MIPPWFDLEILYHITFEVKILDIEGTVEG
jgi:hypothetical protein